MAGDKAAGVVDPAVGGLVNAASGAGFGEDEVQQDC